MSVEFGEWSVEGTPTGASSGAESSPLSHAQRDSSPFRGARSRMKDPGFEKVYSRYQKSVGFNQQIDLYNTVENNENFFIGKGLPM